MHGQAPKIRIIIPAKDEMLRIGRTVTAFCEHFGDRATIAVIANGCTDDTAEIVRRLQARFNNLRLQVIPLSIGKGGAVRAGLMLGNEEFVAYVDADGSTQPRALDYLLASCVRSGDAGAIGSRWQRDSNVDVRQPLLRRIASRTFNFLVRATLGLQYHDTQCGAKVFRRSAVDAVIRRLELANFAFDIDLLFLLSRNGYVVKEYGIAWNDVAIGSKVSLFRNAPSMLFSLLRLRILHSPMRGFPFIDQLARSGSIPVRSTLRLLILRRSGRTAAVQIPRRTLELEYLPGDKGVSTEIVDLTRPIQAIRFVLWYLIVGHSSADALVGLNAGLLPNFVLALSRKPTALMSGPLSSIHERWDEDSVTPFVSLVETLLRRMSDQPYFRENNTKWVLHSPGNEEFELAEKA